MVIEQKSTKSVNIDEKKLLKLQQRAIERRKLLREKLSRRRS